MRLRGGDATFYYSRHDWLLHSHKALGQLKAYGDETEQGKLFISEIELREAELFKNKEQLLGVKSRR